jgi:tyrosyl-tRNA synthetase
VAVWQSVAVPSLVADLRFRGLIHSLTDPALLDRLDGGHLTAYSGFDPTAPSLHAGSLLQLCTLRRLQLAGHRPIVLLGGGTGLIGDPGGKSGERSLQTDEELAVNLAGIRPQLARFVDFASADETSRAVLVDNADWLGPLTLVDFLRQVGKHFTVNHMVAKESVRSRFERADQGISYTEFSYMLLQAYDFLRLYDDWHCELQVGGSDQWGNITTGVELVRKVAGQEVFGLTTPLVTKADGTKFGKTESGAELIWLDPALTTPYRLYQFFLQSEDAVVGSYLRYFTFLSHAEIEDLDADTATHPERRAAQRTLAREVVSLVHGPEESERAERASTALFAEGLEHLDERTLAEVLEDAPTTAVERASVADGLPLVDALTQTGLATSRSDARRAIEQGGIYVNNRRQPDVDAQLTPADLLSDRYVVLRRGRRDHNVLIVG